MPNGFKHRSVCIKPSVLRILNKMYSFEEDKDKENQLVCATIPPRSKLMMSNLIKRIHNKDSMSTTSSLSYQTWQVGSKNTKIGVSIDLKRRLGIHRKKKKPTPDGSTKESPLHQFRRIAKKVRLLNNILRNIRALAAENSGHTEISTVKLQLQDTECINEQKDLLFNPDDYVSKYQVLFPRWARQVCALLPRHRTTEQIQNMTGLMRQLKDFCKYSSKMLFLLAKIVRFERFGRRRVIVRKGQIGLSFYVIFSGSVGVTVNGDENRLFENEEKTVIVLRRGDSFGEIALMRRSLRTATVACLETTEFLVIDKEDFYESGVDKFTQEEMIQRCNFIKSMDLFSSWDDKDIQEVAEGGRNLEFLSDRVIDMDTSSSEYVYIITKGSCTLLRLLDLTKQEYLKRRQKKATQIRSPILSPSSGYHSSYTSEKDSVTYLPVYNSPSPRLQVVHSEISDKLSALSFERPRSKVQTSETSLPDSLIKNNDDETIKTKQNLRSSPGLLKPNTKTWKHVVPKVLLNSNLKLAVFSSCVRDAMSLRNASNAIGLGAFIKIDTLTRGKSFGLKFILPQEEYDIDCHRKFILMSSGCELIRIPKSVLRTHADNKTLSKIKKESPLYPSDGELYDMFIRHNEWRTFREDLVEKLMGYKQKIAIAKKERSAIIPTMPKIQRTCLSRAESPTNHLEKLCNEGLVKKGPLFSFDNGVFAYCITPLLKRGYNFAGFCVKQNRFCLENRPLESTNLIHSVLYLLDSPKFGYSYRASSMLSSTSEVSIKHSSFVQNQLLAAQGSKRKLVLTHGGIRVNRLSVMARLTSSKSMGV